MKIAKTIFGLAMLIAAVAAKGATVTLTSGTGEVTLQDNDVLTGTGGTETHVTIADGATVTLNGVNITAIPNVYGDVSHKWAGITCESNAVIILQGYNVVKGGYEDYPGILVPAGGTLRIQGKGALDASSNGYGAGIGGGNCIDCGNISLAGGTITVTGGFMAAGIGGGALVECGDINIGGGTVVTATGGSYAPGIGGGAYGSGGSVTIAESARCVTAISDEDAPCSIGAGAEGECGTVTVEGVVQTGGVTASPYIYNPCITNITSAAAWDAFASRVSRGVDTYEDLTVTLSTDISVSTMVGKTVDNTPYPFSGTFDGGGHTLTVSLSGSGAVAPFSVVGGATIRNLSVAGTVSGGFHSSGLVGSCSGTSTNVVSNCTVSVAVTAANYAGGIVGHGGNGGRLVVKDSVFAGSISGFGNFAGGILGWCDSLTLTLDNCLVKGSFSPASGGRYHPIACKLGGNNPVTATTDRLYYLYTIAPTVIGSNNTIAGAAGAPVSATRVPFEWTAAVTAADALTYYAATPTVTLTAGTGLVTLHDGDILTGTGGAGTRIVIAAGATVMLRNATISGSQASGITCEGNAVVVLKGANSVRGESGIVVPDGATLVIQGDGGMEAGSSGSGGGIVGNVAVGDGLIDVADGSTRRIIPGLDIFNDESNAAAIAQHEGRTEAVCLRGRTLYTDGRYNTLCLPFSMSATQIAASPLAGAEIKTLDGTDADTGLRDDGTLKLKFTDVASIGAGRPYVVRWSVIRSAADWNTFASRVANGTESYEGKVVRLAADISVTTMVGSRANPFKGTFDGCGHVLIFNYTSDSDSEPNIAPFLCVEGATIKNLVVLGSAVSATARASGIVGESVNLSHIVNCRVNSTISGNYYCGGISTGGKVAIENSLFDGKITCNRTSGGFVGWSEPSMSIRNCLFAPQDGSSLSGGTFYYLSGSGYVLPVNSYYTTALGSIQGESAENMTAEQLRAALGEGWELVGGHVFPVMPRSDFVISSAADWNTLAEAVALGYTYEGRTVRLAADITVTTMVGNKTTVDNVDVFKSFWGTFDGGGHTLTFNYETNQAYCAPFLSAEQATFENLKVAGTIKPSAKFASGLIAVSWGDCTIRNCQVGIVINSQVQGDGTHGGFIAISGDGADSNSDMIRFENCLFNGRFRGSSTTLCGGFVGWNQVDVSYTSCLFDPAEQQFASGATFSRKNAGTFTRAYYTVPLGTVQGLNASQMTAEQLLSALGDGWTLYEEGGQSHVVPKLCAYSDFDESAVGDLLFTNVTVSSETSSAEVGVVEYVIRSAADWNALAANVESGAESYDGWFVRLAADISISTMVGTTEHPFMGTFDGCGHTLNLDITDVDHMGTAPFRYVSGATIANVKTTGTVTGELHCSGLVGFVDGASSLIRNCEVAASVSCIGSTHSHCGGILGHGSTSYSVISNCLFSGTISGADIATGIIYGWGDYGLHTIVNCLAAGTYTNCSGIDLVCKYGGAVSVSNSYKTRNVGSLGIYTTETGSALAARLGDGWTTRNGAAVPKMSAYHEVVAEFVGTTSPVALGSGYRSTLIIADDGTLAVPRSGTTVSSCRAFFRLTGLPEGVELSGYALNYGVETASGVLDIPTASGYELWASENNIAGAASATDANGVANVFRYAFGKPSGAFANPALLAIAFEGGHVVIYTPPLANTEGYTFGIVASDTALGEGSVATYALDPSGRTVINETGKNTRFFRLRAVESE